MLSKKTISSRLAIITLIVLLIFLADLKYKQWKNQQEIEKQKSNLLAQADTLQKKNNELNQSLQYLNSPSFKERVAREQLNLKKDGEVVYSFGDAPDQTMEKSKQETKIPNPQKWWDYFFSAE